MFSSMIENSVEILFLRETSLPTNERKVVVPFCNLKKCLLYRLNDFYEIIKFSVNWVLICMAYRKLIQYIICWDFRHDFPNHFWFSVVSEQLYSYFFPTYMSFFHFLFVPHCHISNGELRFYYFHRNISTFYHLNALFHIM